MIFWIHFKPSLDQASLHRDRCLEIPSTSLRSEFWEGGWHEYLDKETALDALENTGATRLDHCPICKP